MKFSDALVLLPFVDDITHTIADIQDKDSAKDKAADVVEDLFSIAIKYLTIANPPVAAEISVIYTVVKPALDLLKDKQVQAPVTPATVGSVVGSILP